jgi:hypothetical protein
MIQYLGKLGIDDAVPILAIARTRIAAVVNLVLPDIQGRLDGALRLQVNIRPPSIVNTIRIVTALLAALQVAIVPPSVDFATLACLQLVARLQGVVASLQAALGWGALPGTVHVFWYEGRVADMAAAVAAELPAAIPGTVNIAGPIIVVETSDSVALASLRTVVRTP